LSLIGLLRPHWKAFTLALLAVVGETLGDVLEPWPIKVVVDDLQHKKLSGWLDGTVTGLFGHGEFAMLNFAVTAVATIAVSAPSAPTPRNTSPPASVSG
jgi:subfamily B ATP-binding cassette protein MsbA